ASMGQVHKATKNGKNLAVKIQYPGVADSIKADLKMVKPFASMILGLPDKDIDKYLQEVETKLTEETDYDLELRRSVEISEACAKIPNLVFTEYYPDLSCQKILTMGWLEGVHLKEFLLTNPSQEVRNQIGQALWEFYNFQMHTIRAVHADPHPGNFLMRNDGTLGIIDFGCVKEIPESFYKDYFCVINPYFFEDKERMKAIFYKMEFLTEKDSPKDIEFFTGIFNQLISLLTRPYRNESEYFDFSDDAYFQEIYEFGESLAKQPEIMNSKEARGSKDSLYINRTFFGLYSILNELKCNNIHITRPDWLKEKM
ncbi:MAG: AarF/ABC1/UbiB kinase family protein, partial [Bacteroidetes bacterium]